ncbi:hypothetical protein Patl1_24826 [Pistacia atlantica]|uniref:Uncharacterized protein n=1 Tax=Pistacia atlantica TaxID=434234 RepID=A0ACC1B3S8_9ROSI|nr:hypothetical protein Patl1_24826 [Pistacia atlantica]
MAAKLIVFVSSIVHLFIIFFIQSTNSTHVNVITYGAKPDGKTDSTQSFLEAWRAACSSGQASSTILIPKGRYLIMAVEFGGPCRNRITVQINGTIVAPSDNYRGLGKSKHWILFRKVDNLSVKGGHLDAKGAAFWACRKSRQNCPAGAKSIIFSWANNIKIRDLTSINSQVGSSGTRNLLISNIKCGPGHGVSIGSLARKLQ